MIDVNSVKLQIDNLSKKDQAGYSTKDEFNLDLNAAQTFLFQYFYKQYQDSQNVVDALEPFLLDVQLPVAIDGRVDYPVDYAHWAGMYFRMVKNNPCKDPTVSWLPIDLMMANEFAYTMSNSIRKPSIENEILRYRAVNNAMFVYPNNLKNIKLVYFRKPIDALWNTITVVTPTEDIEEYDPATSIQLEWNKEQEQDFVDIMLFLRGIEIRETALIQFVKLKQKEGIVN